jgi:ArsR family transcriptional regulator, arsenate/arsenite/antimonite-responsive transcriptional repressor
MPSPTPPVIAPRRRRAGGCREAAVEPELSLNDAVRLAATIKALADPTRLRIVDALRSAAPHAICQCELAPLFDISQQALAKHLRVLIGAGVIGSERRGLWTYYFMVPRALADVEAWLR